LKKCAAHIFVLVLVMVFAVYVYRSFLQKKKINIEITQQKRIIEEKQKEILDSIYYARLMPAACNGPLSPPKNTFPGTWISWPGRTDFWTNC
jgi:cell division protein FtsL